MQLLVSNHAAGEEAGVAMLELEDVGVIDVVIFLGSAAQILTKHAREDVSHILKWVANQLATSCHLYNNNTKNRLD